MNDRERAVNQDLQILGDAYRLRQIRRDEYRLRRRHVLAGLRGADEGETTRKPPPRKPADAASAATGANAPRPAAGGAGPARTGIAWKYWLLFAFGVAVVAGVAWVLLRSPDELARGPAPVIVLAIDAAGASSRDPVLTR